MAFESLPKKTGLKEATLGLSALMSATTLEVTSPQDIYPVNSYQIETPATEDKFGTTEVTMETDSSEEASEEAETNQSNEEEEETSLESIPTPRSFIEDITSEQLEVFRLGIERYQAYAKEDPVEHAGVFIIKKDGRAEWIDREVEELASESGMQMIEMKRVKIPETASKLLMVHTHPTKYFEGSGGAVDIPPSFIDIRGSLEGQFTNDPSIVQEHMVVTEAGMWRYGPKSSLVVEQHHVLQEIGIEALAVLDDKKVQLQAEIFMQKLVEYMLDNGYPREQLEQYSDKINDINLLKIALQSELSFVVGLNAFVKELESQPDYNELGVEDFSKLIMTLYQKKQGYIANKSSNADLDTFVSTPTAFTYKFKEGEPTDRSEQWSSYINKWEALGIYIEPVD